MKMHLTNSQSRDINHNNKRPFQSSARATTLPTPKLLSNNIEPEFALGMRSQPTIRGAFGRVASDPNRGALQSQAHSQSEQRSKPGPARSNSSKAAYDNENNEVQQLANAFDLFDLLQQNLSVLRVTPSHDALNDDAAASFGAARSRTVDSSDSKGGQDGTDRMEPPVRYLPLDSRLTDPVPKRTVEIEANFDLGMIALKDSCSCASLDQDGNMLFQRFIESQRYYIFPEHPIAIDPKQHDVDMIREQLSVSAEWKLPSDDSRDPVSQIRRRKMLWQKALFSLLDQLLDGATGDRESKVDSFYVLPQLSDDVDASDSDSKAVSKPSERVLSASGWFFRDRSEHGDCSEQGAVFAVISGTTSAMIKRLHELGVEKPLVIKDSSTEAVERLKQQNKLSVAGAVELARSGKSLLLCGAYQLRVFAQVLAEHVFASHNRSKFIFNVPYLASSHSFKFAVRKDTRVSLASCRYDFDELSSVPTAAGVSARAHRVHLSGFVTSTMLDSLTALLVHLGDTMTDKESQLKNRASWRMPIDGKYLVPSTSFSKGTSGQSNPVSSARKRDRDFGGEASQGSLVSAHVGAAMSAFSTSSLRGPMKLTFSRRSQSDLESRNISSSMVVDIDSARESGAEASSSNPNNRRGQDDGGASVEQEDANTVSVLSWIKARKNDGAEPEKFFAIKCVPISSLSYCSYVADAISVLISHSRQCKASKDSGSETCLESEQPQYNTSKQDSPGPSSPWDIGVGGLDDFPAAAVKANPLTAAIAWRFAYKGQPSAVAASQKCRLFGDAVGTATMLQLHSIE
jgi:hypothetical protein